MELPAGWAEITLKNILPIQYGKGLIEAHRDKNGHVPVYGSSGLVGYHNQPLTSKAALVIGRKGSVGSVYFSPVPCWPIDTTYFVEENDSVNLKFFLHLLLFLRLSQFDKSTAVPGLSRDDYNAITVKIAPFPEQHRIVAAIEQQFSRLDAGVAALKRAKVKLKRYRAAVLKAAVEGKLTETWRAEHPTTEPASPLLERILKERRAKWEADLRAKGKDPAKVKYVEPAAPDVESLPELPGGWCWAKVDQLITYLRNGLPQKPEASPPGHRILRINAVRPMSVDLDEVRYLFLPQQQLEGYLLDNGDLLFTRYNGSLELLGVAGLVRGCSLPTLHPDKLIRVKTVLAEPLSLYIELASNVGISRTYIESKARTTAGQTGISGSDIRQIPIPLPSLKEQEQIVAEVERHLSLISQLEVTVAANLKRAERLRQSILREAFTGRLVPQDPTDEPASVLLERIRNEHNGQNNGTRVNDKKNRSVRVPEPVTLDIVEAEQTELWESVGN